MATATPPQLHEEAAVAAALAIDELRAQVEAAGDVSFDFLADLLPGLIASYAEATATIAAEWYADHRAELGITGSYEPLVPDFGDTGVVPLLKWADSEATTPETRVSLIEGGTFRRVEDGARQTVMQNVQEDPKAAGWQRYARQTADGCGFCQALAGRGSVYRSEYSGSFGAHDSCRCVAVPAFQGAPIPVRPYTPSRKRPTAADRRRVREWVARTTADQ